MDDCQVMVNFFLHPLSANQKDLQSSTICYASSSFWSSLSISDYNKMIQQFWNYIYQSYFLSIVNCKNVNDRLSYCKAEFYQDVKQHKLSAITL